MTNAIFVFVFVVNGFLLRKFSVDSWCVVRWRCCGFMDVLKMKQLNRRTGRKIRWRNKIAGEINLPSLVISTHAQCLQHSTSGVGTTFGICLELHFKCFGGLAGIGHAGRHSTFPRSQKQFCSQPVKFDGISLQFSKYCPLYSHVPLSTQRMRSAKFNVCGFFFEEKKQKKILNYSIW